MTELALLSSATNTCVKNSTAGTVTGFVIFAAIIGGIVVLAIANGRARRQLSLANTELAYLRPESARLQQWIAHLTGSSTDASPVTGYPASTPLGSQWHADPSERHELRFWDGTRWTEHVADRGVTSTDSEGSNPPR